MKKNEDGFSTPFAMIIIFSLCVMLSSLSLLLFTKQKKMETLINNYDEEKTAEKFLKTLLEDFQIFKESESDSNFSEIFIHFKNKYSEKLIEIKDVSTGINERFIKKEILETEYFKKLMSFYNDEIKTEYGWINEKYADKNFIKELKSDFEKENLFPLVNQVPLFNVNFMKADFIEAVLNYCKIPNYKTKAQKIFEETQNTEINIEQLKEILEVQNSHKVYDFLGTKTQFWKIILVKNSFEINAVIAAIPEKKDSAKIEKYIIVEQSFFKKAVIYD